MPRTQSSSSAADFSLIHALTQESVTVEVAGTSYLDTGLLNQATFFYVVTAVNAGGESAPSNEAEATPSSGSVPLAPTGLIATGLNASVSLSWSSVSGADGYVLLRSETNGGLYKTVSDVGAVTTWTDSSNLFNGTTYYYVVQAYNTHGYSPPSSQAAATPSAPSSIPALFVVGNTTLSAADNAIKTRLEALGYTLTIIKDSNATSGHAAGKGLVFISASVAPASVGVKFRDVTVPVICCEHGIYDDMGMTLAPTSQHGTQSGQTQLTIADSAHPLAGGLTGTQTVVTTARPFTWGKPGTSAAKVAHLVSDATKWVIFGYETGATMPAVPSIAPARRVGFFLESAAAANLNANGNTLFNAAVQWATNAPLTPALSVQAANASVKLKWTPSEGALTYTVLRSTSPTSGFVVIQNGLSQTEFIDLGVTNNTTYYYQIRANSAAGGISLPSASVAGTPIAGGTLVVGITGRKHIRVLRPGSPFDPVWNEGEYFIYAYMKNGSTFTPATVTSSNWDFFPTTPQSATVATYVNNPLRMTITANAPQSDPNFSETLFFAVNVTVSEAPFNPELVHFRVEMGNRTNMNAMLRFPQNGVGGTGGLGQTQRPWGTGSPNNFFVGGTPALDTLRANDRNNFSGWLCGNASAILAQAGVKLYDVSNSNFLPLQPGYFDIAGRVQSGLASGVESPQLRGIFAHNLPGGGNNSIINIYMVHRVWDFDPNGTPRELGGVTYPNLSVGPIDTSTTILLSDLASFNGIIGPPFQVGQNPESTLAHELGHALGWSWDSTWVNMTGALNNLKDVIADQTITATQQSDVSPNNPLNWNLMRTSGQGRRNDANGNWLTDDQVIELRSILNGHQARGFID